VNTFGTSIKESLYTVIEKLSDEEARKILEYTDQLKTKSETTSILKQLESDPTFKIPASDLTPFPKVKPVKGKGIPASELLEREGNALLP
jgi:hypothetical protein